jgi:ketosteroid isomerase-like protein
MTGFTHSAREMITAVVNRGNGRRANNIMSKATDLGIPGPPLDHGESAQEEQIRAALDAHWHASAIGDADAEHDIYADNAVCEYPQSGERILGRVNLQALRSHHPGKPSGFKVMRIVGKGDFWVTEYIIIYQGRSAYTVSIMEFDNGKVGHETQYFADPFEAPAWRSQWVQRIP